MNVSLAFCLRLLDCILNPSYVLAQGLPSNNSGNNSLYQEGTLKAIDRPIVVIIEDITEAATLIVVDALACCRHMVSLHCRLADRAAGKWVDGN